MAAPLAFQIPAPSPSAERATRREINTLVAYSLNRAKSGRHWLRVVERGGGGFERVPPGLAGEVMSAMEAVNAAYDVLARTCRGLVSKRTWTLVDREDLSAALDGAIAADSRCAALVPAIVLARMPAAGRA